jgi:hypothetical protein
MISGASLDDTQSFTVANGASFAPGSTSDNKYVIAASVSHNYNEGQKITLVNGGGSGVDLTGRITDIDSENITIEFSSPTTFVSTGNTVALSGTWSGSGTTLTGSGGAANTEFTGPTYITDGTEWRKVIRVVNNNSIIIQNPFPTALSATSLLKLVVNIQGIPSQQYGARIFGSTARVLLKGCLATGNVLERTLFSTQATIEPGSEYWRKTTTTITGSGSTVDLMTGLFAGNRIAGWATLNSVAITGGGATSFTLRHTDSGGATKEEYLTGLSLSLNQRPRQNAAGQRMATSDKIVAVFAGGTPTAGQIILEAFFKTDMPDVLPTV